MSSIGNLFKGVLRTISGLIRLSFIGGLAAGTFLKDAIQNMTKQPTDSDGS